MVPFLLLCTILLFSCEKPADMPEVTIMQVYQDDMEIARIAEDARSTLPVFFRYLTREGAGNDHCYVKYPLMADDDSGISMEQIWLTGIRFKNGRYFGVLASVPRYLSGMKRGDTVIFDMDAITDWMYVQGEKIIGGESIKYLLEKIPEEQRNDRDRELLRMLY
jgi:uncharacterized protein YegJ (DUF2314 family)